MSLAEIRQRITWRAIDKEGQRGTVGVFPVTPEDHAPSVLLGTLTTALRAISVSAINSATGDTLWEESAAGAPTTGAYENIEDKAFLIFETNGSTEVVIEVPCPKATDFLADKETVDPLDTAMAAFISAVTAYAADKAGHALIAFVRGYRDRKKHRS